MDHHQLRIIMIQTIIWTFQHSNTLKNCKEVKTELHGMLIYEIVRCIMNIELNFNLSCTFPKGNRLISLVLSFHMDIDRPTEVQEVELDPEAPINVLVPFSL